MIEKNVFPIPQIGEATRKTRKIGLGVMGVHDAMLMIGLAYDSTEGRAWCEQVMKLVTDTAVDESHRLAEAKGPFPAWKGSTWKDFTVRNAAMTTVAPTGTISLLAGCSSGIEPVFSFAYTRKNTVGKTFVIVNPVFKEALVRTLSDMGFAGEEREKKAEEVIAHVHETGTIQDLHWLPEGFLALFKTALDIPWRDHILMQASFQKHVHASISKTINMPCSATKEDCEEALLMAWKLGLKGITIYRTGSRDDVVLALKEKSPAAPTVQGLGEPATAAAAMRAVPEKIPSLSIDRPKELAGRTYLCQSGCCRLYVTVNLHGGKTHGGLYPDGRERGVRREQQCAWPCDQHRPPEWRALREICQTVRKSELHLRDQEPLLGRPLLCGRGRAVHRAFGKKPERRYPQRLEYQKDRGAAALPRVPQPAGLRRGLQPGDLQALRLDRVQLKNNLPCFSLRYLPFPCPFPASGVSFLTGKLAVFHQVSRGHHGPARRSFLTVTTLGILGLGGVTGRAKFFCRIKSVGIYSVE